MFRNLTLTGLVATAITCAMAPSHAVTMRTVVCSDGKVVKIPDSQSKKMACQFKSKTSVPRPKAQKQCGPGAPTHNCRHYTNGYHKPKPRPKS